MTENTEKRNFRFETLQLHAGHTPDIATRARAVPVYATTSFTFKNAEHAANVFGGKEVAYVYSRYSLYAFLFCDFFFLLIKNN
jgi:O-acetylhomoserine/O-acetylserine sulfhydrylase-like pyridoxal-dependent enzyme